MNRLSIGRLLGLVPALAVLGTYAPAKAMHSLEPWTSSMPAGTRQCNAIYLSDGFDGSIHVLSGKPPFGSIGTLTGTGYGVSVASAKQTIYVGTSGDTIDEYAPCGSAVLKTLKGGGHGPSSSIAADRAGTVYALEGGTDRIDIFRRHRPSFVVKSDPTMATPVFVAVDGRGNIYLQGPGAPSQNLDIVDRCAPGLTDCARFASVPTFPSYQGAGGLTIVGRSQDLIVNDTSGTLYSFTPSGSMLDSFGYVNNGSIEQFDGIALEGDQGAVWGANSGFCNSNFSSFCGDAVRVKLNPSTGKFLAITAVTPPVQQSYSGFIMNGVARYPAAPL